MMLKDCREALQSIADLIGVPVLNTDAEDTAAIRVGNLLNVNLHVMNETQLELSSRLTLSGGSVGAEQARALLSWNATHDGPERISLDPETGGTVLGRRVAVTQFDPAGLKTVLDDFVHAVAACENSGAGNLSHQDSRPSEQAIADMIRI
ncbi:type III secretion system chaperone [Pseudooceanicola aestuarii]|uniref:type III secretion system chaperone n=1 Tax=Pseudooceanicola aestuarii TaxID=2697319 RepID=UPI0013D43F0D|nr:type III secretion system chaperone [Pseudooceanicola aestuarii]